MTDLLQRMVTRLYGSAVAWSFVFTAIRAGGNLLVLPLMLHKLSTEHLGLWYVFLSLGGLAGLVDFGFYPTMSRVTAYIWAGAQDIPATGVPAIAESDRATATPNYKLLADLVKTMQLYYRGLAAAITLVIGIFGTLWLLERTAHMGDTHNILSAWLLFLAGIFINTTSGMWHPLLSGINQVRLNQQVFVAGLLVNYIVIVAGLLSGAGLLAPVAGYFLMGAVSRWGARWKFNQHTRASECSRRGHWSRALLASFWPTAWRTGVVTLGIYATLNLGILICTQYLGLTAAASYGLSMQLVGAAIAIASSFVVVKLPLVARLHALGRPWEIAPIVLIRLRYFWLTYFALAALTLTLGDRVIHGWFHSHTPLLAFPKLAALFLIVGLEGHHALFREIALASHRNPFALPVIVSGAIIVLLSLTLVPYFGLWAVIVVPGIVQLCFNNWWTILIGLKSIDSSIRDYATTLFSPRHARHA